MKTPEQIRDMEFQKSPMGGYKQSDVELFLEEMASEIEILMRQKADAERKLQEFSQKSPDGALSTAGIQNVLVSAQRVAEQIADEANNKAEEIVRDANLKLNEADVRAKEIIADAESKARLLGDTAEKEAAKIIAGAVKESEEIIASAKESVELEQKLYDRLKIEVSDFRKKATAQCSSLIELINQLPAEIPFNMERAKTVLSTDFGNPEELLEKAVNDRIMKETAATVETAEEEVSVPDTVKEEKENNEAEIIITENAEPEAKTAHDDGAVAVAAPVADMEVKDNVQLTFEEKNEEEPIKFSGTVKEEQPAVVSKGHIVFSEDEDDDDEPRLFFKKKKK
jgi:cell division initiation protein